MKRIWIFLLLAVLWCGLAFSVSLLTDDSQYLIWGIFLPPSLWLLNLARPRRGLHYVYWNRYIYVITGLLLGLFAIPIAIGYAVLKFKLSIDIFGPLFVLGMIIFIPGFLLWFKFYFMPSWGTWRLRGRYPKMVAAARRLKKFSEHYTWYIPLIRVQGRPYIMVGYEVQGITGIATLDEEGHFVNDEALAETLIRCYKLAVSVLHMPDSLKRAKDIDSFRKTDRQMQEAYRCFREENKEYFSVTGKESNKAWKLISDFEPDFHTLFMTMAERKMWQTKWALEHGLNRLTEVSDQQLHEVEARLSEFDKILLSYREKIDQVSTEAEVMQLVLPKLADPWETATGKKVHLIHRTVIQDLLKSLVVLRGALVAWKPTVVDFLPREDEWQAWRDRKALAEKLEREGIL